MEFRSEWFQRRGRVECSWAQAGARQSRRQQVEAVTSSVLPDIEVSCVICNNHLKCASSQMCFYALVICGFKINTYFTGDDA